MVHVTDEFQVRALGTQLRVAVTGMSGPDVRRLKHQWEWTPGWGEPSDTVRVVAGPRRLGADVSGDTLGEVSVALRQAINLRAIMSRRHDLMMFHAAGLADRTTGDVIALIGPSGAGKTTVAAALGTCLGYVSDEIVAVTEDGGVVPFPKPLALKRPGTHEKTVYGPDALGLVHAAGHLRLSRIVLLDRREEQIAPLVTTTSLPEVIAEVVEQINCFDALPRPLRFLSALVRRSGGVHVLRYHHAADLIDPVRELLHRPPAPVERLGLSSATVSPDAAEGSPLEAGAYGRAPVDDWVEIDGEILTLADGRVSRLGPLASALWELLERSQTIESLVAPVEAVFGRAPGADTEGALRDRLDQLSGAGLIRAGLSRPL